MKNKIGMTLPNKNIITSLIFCFNYSLTKNSPEFSILITFTRYLSGATLFKFLKVVANSRNTSLSKTDHELNIENILFVLYIWNLNIFLRYLLLSPTATK
jgi:hypothetical protein